MNRLLSCLLAVAASPACISIAQAASAEAHRPAVSVSTPAQALAGQSGCLTDTSQADFAAGVATNVDLASSPGNAILLAPGALDQQNTTVSVAGLGFSSTVWYAQTFTAGATGVLAEVDLAMFCASCSGTTPDITVSIRNVVAGGVGNNELATGTITGFSSGTPAYRAALFSPAPTLTAGSFYAIVVHSNADPSVGNYTYQVSATNPYAGGHSVRSTNGGVSWSSQTTDIGFKTFMRTTYPASGDLVSASRDGDPTLGGSPTWTTLRWQATTPANTSLRFQAAGSNSIAGPFTFVGPDSTAASYFTTSGASLVQFSGNRYLQYRAYLATTSNTLTPVLASVSTCYTQGMPADISISNDDGVASAAPGGSVVYTITATNNGPGDASGVTVADAFPAALSCTWTCDNAGGGSCTAAGAGDINDAIDLPDGTSVSYSATCSIALAAAGSLSNTASANFAGDAALANNSATDTDTLSPQADLSISNTDGAATATPGGPVSYTITAANAGPSNAPGSTVTDTFPASLACSWTCAGANSGTCSASGSGNINDSAVNLPGGGSVTYTANCLVDASATGTLSNTASVAPAAGIADTAAGNNSATDSDTLTVQADVALTISDNRSLVQVGDALDYVIDVTNPNGPSTAIVTVSDALPAELASGSWVCTGSGNATCANGAGTSLSDTATLPVGGKASYVYSASVQSEGAGGEIVNTASASLTSGIDATPGNNSQTDTDLVVIYADGFEGPASVLAPVNNLGADQVTALFRVDAALLGRLGMVPVSIASGRSADGTKLFTLQLARFGGSIALRALTADARGATAISAWQGVDLSRHVLEFAWQSASASGTDGYFAAASGGSPLLIDEGAIEERLSGVMIRVENSVPWLVVIER